MTSLRISDGRGVLGGMTLIGTLRFARQEVAAWRRAWYGSAFSTFVAPFLFLSGIGLGVGQLVEGGGTSPALGGLSYAAFAGTGVLAATSMQIGVGDLSWPVIGALSFTNTWAASTSTPLSPADLAGGKLLYVTIRLIASATVFAIALAALGLVRPVAAAGVIAPAVLTGLACGAPMFAFAAHVSEPPKIGYVFRFLVVPLFILSGTFFPVQQLPALVQPVAILSPVWHGVEVIRLAGLGIGSTWPWALHALVLVAWTVTGLRLTAVTLTRRLHP